MTNQDEAEQGQILFKIGQQKLFHLGHFLTLNVVLPHLKMVFQT